MPSPSKRTQARPPAPAGVRLLRRSDPRVILMDRFANWGITVGGLSVIAAVLGIFVFILMTVWPLFEAASFRPIRSLEALHRPVLAQVDEHQELLLMVGEDGAARLHSLGSTSQPEEMAVAGLPSSRLLFASRSPLSGHTLMALPDGRVWVGSSGIRTRFEGEDRVKEPFFKKLGLPRMATSGVTLKMAALGVHESASLLVAASSNSLRAWLRSESGGFLGPAEIKEQFFELPWRAELGSPSALAVREADTVLVGTASGNIVRFTVDENGAREEGPIPALDNEVVTSMAMVLGQQSVIVGGEKGGLVSLGRVLRGNQRLMERMHTFERMPSPVTSLATSSRDKGFIAGDRDGRLRLYFMTSERLMLEVPPTNGGALMLAAFTPKADGAVVVDALGRVHVNHFHNPHPEVSLKTLFGKVWYEGYSEPEYVWQSTGGTDDFESKFSLTPLIFGTFKGTLYAMLIAVPLALLAAVYTSQFMSARLRGVVKPVIEIMAAVPSVVMGFLAALLLAPLLDAHLFAVMVAVGLIPLWAMASLALWRILPEKITRKVPQDLELSVVALGIFLCMAAALVLSPAVEAALFTDFKTWMTKTWGIEYDPRNSLVVGFAMGFAVIPIIYTICEDSLSSVPRHLVSASLSCGATPWQTAVYVVLPAALSGVFSAVMIGFGRAVGETMIVLMATGNTPVMDMSLFNGFRALSANIAVEIPEAPVDGSLYRVLFVAALVLFAVTFVVNTVAELIRLRLRRKYSQL